MNFSSFLIKIIAIISIYFPIKTADNCLQAKPTTTQSLVFGSLRNFELIAHSIGPGTINVPDGLCNHRTRIQTPTEMLLAAG